MQVPATYMFYVSLCNSPLGVNEVTYKFLLRSCITYPLACNPPPPLGVNEVTCKLAPPSSAVPELVPEKQKEREEVKQQVIPEGKIIYSMCKSETGSLEACHMTN